MLVRRLDVHSSVADLGGGGGLVAPLWRRGIGSRRCVREIIAILYCQVGRRQDFHLPGKEKKGGEGEGGGGGGDGCVLPLHH